MARKLPTQRTLEWLRKSGWKVGVVEKFNSHVGPHGIRQDLFGFIDLVAVKADEPGVLAIQATSGSGVSSRLAKIRANDVAPVWLAGGNKLWVVGWRKLVKRNKDGSKGPGGRPVCPKCGTEEGVHGGCDCGHLRAGPPACQEARDDE